MKTMVSAIGCAALLTFGAVAAPVSFSSTERQTSLLELYTSEGCSSCPPAEAWLNRLKAAPGLWHDFAPLALHVDYWDDLGWRDRQATPEFSQRQRDYAQLWHAENIYTPCFVLNGREWHNWLSLRSAPPAASVKAGILEISTLSATNASRWSARFTPVSGTNDHYEIHAALLVGGLQIAVQAGENRGRTLPHEFALVDLVQLGMTTSNGIARGKFILDTPHHAAEKVLAVTAWVTRAGEMTPLQATGGWLPTGPLEPN